jgi:hypothetical protein
MASTSEQDLLKKTVVELKTILRQGGQPVGGTKPVLIQRILEANLYPFSQGGTPAYEPYDEAHRLRESLLTFILDHFNQEDRDRAGSIGGWACDMSEASFTRWQERELLQIDLPRLQFLEQLAGEIRSKKLGIMSKEEMDLRPRSDGFILWKGRVVATRPR